MAISLDNLIGDNRARLVEAAVDRVAGSPVASLATLAVVAFLCFLPGFMSTPPLDGDEPYYAVAAREMVATGDLATLDVQTDLQPWRPRGAQWLEAAAVVLAGGGTPPIWVFRIPSLLAGVATVLLTWWTAAALGSARMALLSGLLVAGSGVLGLQARLAAPDALLVAATTLAAGVLARLWLARDDAPAAGYLPLVFWLAVGAGLLLGGAVAPAMVAAAVLVLSVERGSFGWFNNLRPGVGVVVLALALLPWLASVAALAIDDAGGPDVAFLTRVGVPFALEAPVGTYALLAPLLVGPAMTFIFVSVPWVVDQARRPAILFALAWGVPLWLAAEFIPQKAPQYVLPAIPMVTIIAAAAIDAGAARIGGKISLFYSAGPLLWPPLIAVALPIAYFVVEGSFPIVALVAFVIAAVLGPVAWLWLKRERAVAAAAMSLVTVVFIYFGFFGGIVPGLGALRVAERIVAVGRSNLACPNPTFAAAGFPEESLVLLAGRDTLLTDGAGAADFLDVPLCRIAAVDTTQISSFRQRADDLGLELVERGRVGGIDLRKFRRVDMHLFSAKSAGK